MQLCEKDFGCVCFIQIKCNNEYYIVPQRQRRRDVFFKNEFDLQLLLTARHQPTVAYLIMVVREEELELLLEEESH